MHCVFSREDVHSVYGQYLSAAARPAATVSLSTLSEPYRRDSIDSRQETRLRRKTFLFIHKPQSAFVLFRPNGGRKRRKPVAGRVCSAGGSRSEGKQSRLHPL
ncbi:hypothetical protein LDENG_00137660 [Lucifuga dentata]|nr:hypothetical protein LDENG_00137660 [Lucifuga dentata]